MKKPAPIKKVTKRYIVHRLNRLTNIFAKASIGDFSKDVSIPKEEDEFTELYVGIQIMLEVIREQIAILNQEKKQLENERNQLRTLIDSLPVGVYIAAIPSGKPLLVNKRAKELLGRIVTTAGTKDYTPAYEVTQPDGRPYPAEEHPLAITIKYQKPVVKSDIIVKRPDKKTVALKVESAPVFDAKGQMTSAIAVFDDITKEREIDRIKTEFISLASHQLRTPLSTIKWYTEILLDEKEKLVPQQQRYVEDVYQSTQRMISLVNALLTASRLELGKFVLNPQPTNVITLAETVIKEMNLKIQAKNLQLTTKYGDRLTNITLDREALLIIFRNIVSNAVRYTPPRGKIAVSLAIGKSRRGVGEGQCLSIKVADTGYGIPRYQQEKVFSRLFRADNIRDKNQDGNGLGLFITKSLVDTMGGSLWFKSVENKGTTFFIYLPLAGLAKRHVKPS